MRVVEFDRFGSPDVLRIVEMPTPRPARGEVLVRVEAAGINFFEVLMRQDRYAETPQLPMRPGVEAAGVVAAVGEAANPELLGARVAAPLFAMAVAAGMPTTSSPTPIASSGCPRRCHSRMPPP